MLRQIEWNGILINRSSLNRTDCLPPIKGCCLFSRNIKGGNGETLPLDPENTTKCLSDLRGALYIMMTTKSGQHNLKRSYTGKGRGRLILQLARVMLESSWRLFLTGNLLGQMAYRRSGWSASQTYMRKLEGIWMTVLELAKCRTGWLRTEQDFNFNFIEFVARTK